MPQTEAVQVAMPFWLLQRLPQAAQFDGEVLVLTSHPLTGLPSQFA